MSSGRAQPETARRRSGLGGAAAMWGGSEAWCAILEADPDLAEGLSPEDRRSATRALRSPVIVAGRPRWEPPSYDPGRTYGLLVLEGLLGRRVKVGPAVGTELLSCGDILRPWDEPHMWELLPPELDWRVFRPARLAVLDERITALIGRRPELAVNFAGRLLRRARSVSYLMAISHQTRVEDKLLATLWHLASSWGRVTSEGVSIPFRLTHEVLGEILGAQRPSVTTALGRLQESGQVRRGAHGGYVLLEDPAQPNM
ncbi:MAG TPA: Crp/Fnr family transcriptional regulator [Solirubrobacteraceae bacterium]|nr:Crp/Fnr family transcriptional regulator [Solirubrobacteraceae bacterium]